MRDFVAQNMSSNTPSMDVLRLRLTPEQFEKCVKFYEADNQLTTEDRLKMRDELQLIIVGHRLVSYGAGMVGFLAPTIYYRFILKKIPNKISFVQKPFLSFILGLTNMLIYSSISRKKGLENKLQSGALNERQANAWRNMDWFNAPTFYAYYSKTAIDPKFKLKDPRLSGSETDVGSRLGTVNNLPQQLQLQLQSQLQLQHGQNGTKAETNQPTYVSSSSNNDPFATNWGLNDNQNLSLWDRIRLEHGFDITRDSLAPSLKSEGNNNAYNTTDSTRINSVNGAINSLAYDRVQSPNVEQDYDNSSKSLTQSAWDKLRNQK